MEYKVRKSATFGMETYIWNVGENASTIYVTIISLEL